MFCGASSVPGLSSTVIDNYIHEFSRLDSIRSGINPGNKTARGLATVQSILSYAGKPVECFENGKWKTLYAWQNLQRKSFEPWKGFSLVKGERWMSLCDVPDLELFPERYKNVGIQTVEFQAGLELSFLHLGTWLLSFLPRYGIIDNLKYYARPLKWISEKFIIFGSHAGGMYLEMKGLDLSGKEHQRKWFIVAEHGDGPSIPVVPAAVLTKKLAKGEITVTGAMPCLGFFNMSEFEEMAKGLDIKSASVTSRE